MRFFRINLSREFVAILVSLCAGLALVLGTGVVRGVGQWYEGNEMFGHAYRKQTTAFMHGHLAIADNPGVMVHDYVWDNGKVQQVWGLGVPIWRLPFELLARACGFDAFPDRLAFAAAYSLIVYLAIKLARRGSIFSEAADPKVNRYVSMGIIAILVIFPSFISLCRTRFWVFEEAASYSYLYGIGLYFGFLHFLKSRTTAALIALAVASGLAPMLRPPLVFYGFAGFALAFYLAWKSGTSWGKLTAAGTAYFAALSVLFLTNWQRFGSPTEFGHTLNFSEVRMAYATRFPFPFRHEHAAPAALEVEAALFGAVPQNGSRWYETDIFPGQSNTLRWREFYMPVFGPTIGLFLTVAWIWGGISWMKKSARSEPASPADLTQAWSLMPTVPIFIFYMHAPGISSRYLMDFGPAFAVGLAGLWMRFAGWRRMESKPAWVHGLAVAALLFCLGREIQAAEFSSGSGGSELTSHDQIKWYFNRPAFNVSGLPDDYHLGTDMRNTRIFGNGDGWNANNGTAQAMVMVFVQDPQQIQLELSLRSGASIDKGMLDCIQAKIGLEPLVRKSVEITGNSATITFAPPKRARYQHGFQVLYIAMIPPEQLGEKNISDFNLTRIGWHTVQDGRSPAHDVETAR